MRDGLVLSVNEEGRSRRRLFGRRKGHALRPRQVALLETLLPRLAIDLGKPPPEKLGDLFANSPVGVHLEIGFGGGEHLLAEAARHPCIGFIGIEPFVNGMAKALAAIEAKQPGNIRLYMGEATELLEWLPTGALARIDLIHPDPWPKRRHWKRRFVQDGSVGEIARVLKPGGEFRFATDVASYAAWTLEHLSRSPDFLWTAERAADWRLPWPGFSGTRYEAKARREGRTSCYLVFRRKMTPQVVHTSR
jgi:tRNA (guanine-N7-)-methyltransferase